MRMKHKIPALMLASLIMVAGQGALAQTGDGILQRIEAMERDLQTLKGQLEDAKRTAAAAKKEAKIARKEATVESTSLSKWHLSGYTVADFTMNDSDDVDNTFGGLKFNPVIHYQYSDLILFEGELEFEAESDGTTKVGLEYASLDFLAHDYATVVAGKFLSPLGQFQERLHPNWINKLTDRPVGFSGSGGMLPLNDLGLMVRGGIPVNKMTVNYSVYVGNGPQVELSSGELEALELEGFGGDDNDNKAVGGRIGILPWPYFEIGASFLTSRVKGKKASGIAGSVSEGDYTFWAVDSAYTRGPWDVRFEYMSSELDSFLSQTEASTATTTVPKTDWDAWYAQIAYQLSGITKAQFLRNLELVGRYGEFDVEGFSNFVTKGAPERRLSFGFNYLLAPSVLLKTSVSMRDPRQTGLENSTEFKAQATYGF